jgi:hypothetical protein
MTFSRQSFTRFFLASALALLISACASTPSSQEGEVSKLGDTDKVKEIAVEPKARSAFFQAERFFRAQEYKQASQAYLGISEEIPGHSSRDAFQLPLGNDLITTRRIIPKRRESLRISCADTHKPRCALM